MKGKIFLTGGEARLISLLSNDDAVDNRNATVWLPRIGSSKGYVAVDLQSERSNTLSLLVPKLHIAELDLQVENLVLPDYVKCSVTVDWDHDGIENFEDIIVASYGIHFACRTEGEEQSAEVTRKEHQSLCPYYCKLNEFFLI